MGEDIFIIYIGQHNQIILKETKLVLINTKKAGSHFLMDESFQQSL